MLYFLCEPQKYQSRVAISCKCHFSVFVSCDIRVKYNMNKIIARHDMDNFKLLTKKTQST